MKMPVKKIVEVVMPKILEVNCPLKTLGSIMSSCKVLVSASLKYSSASALW